MQRPKLSPALAARLRRMESSPSIRRFLQRLDRTTHFLNGRQYGFANSALDTVRTPLIAGLWGLLAFVLAVLVWGTFASIESAAVAKGSVVLFSNKKIVQHLEGGIIDELLVKEGDVVAAGQPLIRLRDTAANSSRDALQQQLDTARANEARLVAERDKQEALVFDNEMQERSKTDTELAKILETQTSLFASEREGQQSKLGALEQRVAQAKAEIDGLNAQVDGTERQLSLLAEEINSVQALLSKGYATKPRLLELQRNQGQLQGSKGQLEAQVAKANENITELQMQIRDQEDTFASKNAEALRDAHSQTAELEEKLRVASDVAGRTIISAPVGGVVTGMKFHTPGGVIAPGASVMDIVPQDEPLIIEAQVRPVDIDTVRPGLNARMIFSAYKNRTTPKIPGKVTQVSADAFTDEHSMPPRSYYVARIEVDKSFIEKLKKPIEMYPGMPVEVLINTGSRSFLSYLFQPITDSMRGAFREK